MLMVMRESLGSSSSTKAPWDRSSNSLRTLGSTVLSAIVIPLFRSFRSFRFLVARGQVLVFDRHLAHRVVLAQRVALPFVGHEDAAQVGVALEDDAEHVIGLPLEPVGPRPDAGDTRHCRRLPVDADDHPDAGGRAEIGQRADDLEARPAM